MANKHSYAAESARTLSVLSSIAFVSALSAVAFQIIFNFALTRLWSKEEADRYGWLISPLTLTGFYSLYFTIFKHVLWKYILGVPCLAGTWVGFTLPNYQDWPHLLIMKVEQTWTDMCVIIYVYYKNASGEPWGPNLKLLGIDNSVTARLSSKSNNEVSVIVVYEHTGMRPGRCEDGRLISRQPNFLGTIAANAILSSPSYKMIGTVYTNRYDEHTKLYGSHGRLRLKRFRTGKTDPEDIYKAAEREGILDELQREVLVQ